MRILFAALHPGYYRNFDSVVEELARRGHDVHLGFEKTDSTNAGETLVERLMARWPRLTCGRIPSREPDSATLLAKTRLGFDYLRYLNPIYPPTSFLPGRAKSRAPTGIVRLTEIPLLRFRAARRAIAHVLDAIDRAVPTSPAIDQYLEGQRPDLVVITPLLGVVGSSQLDLLRSAQARRLRTAVCVYSWDHLTSKALIRDVPDGLFVWNEAQRKEATDLHGVPRERIVVTGAQCFDHWFGRGPSRSRSEFIRHVGLPDDRPYVLWVCSTLLPGGPSEPELAIRWLRHLRASADPRVRAAAVLIRPHPSRMSDWDGVDWRSLGNVTLFGHTPIDDGSRSDYFDSLYHSAAVVGITTTAFLDAAVVGRPVMTIFFDEVRQEHHGSLHFQHLLKFAGGLVTVARSLQEHERQLAAMLDTPPTDVMEQQRTFVRAFVRPHGLDVSATVVMADALERIGRSATTIRARTPSSLGLFGLRGLTIIARHRRWRHLLLSERESAHAAQIEAKRRLRRAQERLADQDGDGAEKKNSSSPG